MAAAPADDTAAIEQVMQALASHTHSRANFVETKYMRLLTRPLTVSGVLTYTAPDRLEKHTLKPNDERLVVDGDNVTVEIKVRQIRRTFRLQESAALWGFIESLRGTLRGDLATLKRFYATEFSGGMEKWQLVLTPLDPAMKAVIRQVRIGGSDGRMQSVEIVEASGDRSVMTIREEPR